MTPETNTEIVAYIAWCMKVLEGGVFPTTDCYNQPWPPGSWREKMGKERRPIAGPYSGSFVAVTHDAKARKETHLFANFYSCRYVCNLCPACSHVPLLSWANHRADARWKRYLLSHDGYVESRPTPSHVTPWNQVPGFDITRALYDWMHSMHLGIGKDITAQLIYDLCRFAHVEGATLEAQLVSVWQDFRKWCREHKVKYSRRKLTPRIIGKGKDGEFPEMNSRTKAAHIKPLVHYLAFRWRRVVRESPAATQEDKLRAWCVYGLADTLYIFDSAGVLLSRQQGDRVHRSGRTMLLCWQALACSAIDKNECNYKLRPKSHYVDHVLDQVAEGLENPRVLSNFMDEDFIGKVVALAKQQHRANVVPRTIELYMMMLREQWDAGV
jgi:hypothetical protein